MRIRGLSRDDAVRNFRDGHEGYGGNVFTNPDATLLLSYGHHFVLAMRLPKGNAVKFLVNGDKYSPSTGQHQAIAQRVLKEESVTIGLSAFPFNLFDRLHDGSAVVVDGVEDRSDRWYGASRSGDTAVDDSQSMKEFEEQHGAGWDLRYSLNADGTTDRIEAHRPGGCLVRLRKAQTDWNSTEYPKRKLPAGLYLCGMDEGSYFVCLLPAKCSAKTCKEAYDALIPQSVKQAKPRGATILRQGEWFFIDSPNTTKDLKHIQIDKNIKRRISNRVFTPRSPSMVVGALEKTLNDLPLCMRALDFTMLTPANVAIGNLHYVREIRQDDVGNVYCRGCVRHSEGSHKSIMLKTWHRVGRNTARQSWSADADVD